MACSQAGAPTVRTRSLGKDPETLQQVVREKLVLLKNSNTAR